MYIVTKLTCPGDSHSLLVGYMYVWGPIMSLNQLSITTGSCTCKCNNENLKKFCILKKRLWDTHLVEQETSAKTKKCDHYNHGNLVSWNTHCLKSLIYKCHASTCNCKIGCKMLWEYVFSICDLMVCFFCFYFIKRRHTAHGRMTGDGDTEVYNFFHDYIMETHYEMICIVCTWKYFINELKWTVPYHQ